MWMTWIMVAMMAIAGCFVLSEEVRSPVTVAHKNADLAESMSIYRNAVIAFVAANPTFAGGEVPVDKLPLPSWYTRYPLPLQLWRNHVEAGVITIYAAQPQPVNITADLLRLSHNSVLVGVADMRAKMFRSPLFPDVQSPLPAGIPIPDGSPVWLARRN
ncbi:type IV pilus biogenesis protein PilM [Paraherbaspirillum soli]|uniref:Type IV pilus biogenesis protein PilM n=1 Tax=Paraherbaspirillum soli TaxID=631222 RepID=A0ABW0M9W2_9BURK